MEMNSHFLGGKHELSHVVISLSMLIVALILISFIHYYIK